MKRIVSQKFRFLFGLIIGSFILLITLPVQANAYEHIEQFDATYDIQEDGSVIITEKILYDFGSEDRHGIFRTIPNRFTYGIDNVNLQIDVLDVTDENSNSYMYETSGFDSITIQIGDPDNTISGQHWYVITYTAQQAVQSYSQHDELYWNVTGTEWEVPISHVTATVNLPEAGDPTQYSTTCYSGAYGYTNGLCAANEPGDGTFTYSADDLSYYSGLTIVAGFQPELVTNPFRPTMIDEFISDIEILEDGSADVLTLFHVRYNILYFGSTLELSIDRSGITNGLAAGENHEFQDIEIQSITDYDGNPYNYIVDDERNPYYISIDVPRPTMDRWYSVHYIIPNAIEQQSDYDELTLKIINDDWQFPIENITAFISLPDTATTTQHTQWCYSGYDIDDLETCRTAEMDEPNQWAYLINYLDAYTPMVVDLKFDPGIVTPNAVLNVFTSPEDSRVYLDDRLRGMLTTNRIRSSGGEHMVRVEHDRYLPAEQAITLTAGESTDLEITLQKSPWWILLETYIPIGLFFGGGAFIFGWWWVFGRDPKGRGTIIPQYEAMDNMTPGEVGVVIDSRAHIHDITATIIHLAVRGYITIKKTSENNFTFKKNKEIEDTALAFETEVFRAIFPQPTTKERSLSEMKNKFYSHLSGIRRSLYQQVVTAGYYKTAPHVVRALYITLAILACIVLFYGSLFLSAVVESGWYVLLAGLGVEAFALSLIMTKRTRHGVEAYEHILGLKHYLTVAEQSRLKFHQSPKAYQHHFEELLPYAIALKVEKEWVGLFDGMFDKAPDWYQSDSSTFNSLLFMNALSSFEKSTASTVTSTPSSSGGGSGFSGGGFSGGGFGGGGGGSW